MSSAPNPSSQPSKSASSSQSRTEAQANSAPEPSSPAETMTDKPSSLATPPTRMTPSEDAAKLPVDTPATDPSGADTPAAEPASTQAVSTQALDQTAESVDLGTSEADSSPIESSAPTEPPSPDHQPVSSLRQQPIPPASEPMQYRAIGLVRGKYTPSVEQFTRGFILTDDGVLIDAVLLGRVMSLVKKHIELEESHLWVVYPRTREKDLELHMQIVGVWEPEKLNRSETALDDADGIDSDDDSDDDNSEDVELEDSLDTSAEADVIDSSEPSVSQAEPDLSLAHQAESKAELGESSSDGELDDRYFSVRGEVVYQSEEEKRLLVKIRRAPKPGTTQAKTFKVALVGTLEGKALGYFWDFQVQRNNSDLVIQTSTKIGMVPPQKRSAGGGGKPSRYGSGPGRPRGGQAGGPPRKRWQNSRDSGSRDAGRPQRTERSERPNSPSTPRQPISKPVKRRPSSDQE